MWWWTLDLLWWSFQISNHYVIHLKLTWGCLSTVSQLKIYIMQLIQCHATCTSPPPWTTSYSKISPCFTIPLPHLHWYPGPVCEEPAFLLPQDHLLEEQPEWTAREGGGVASPGSAVPWWQPLTTSDDSFLSPSDTRKSSRWMACGIWKASPWPRTHQTRVCGRALHPALRSLFCEPTYRQGTFPRPRKEEPPLPGVLSSGPWTRWLALDRLWGPRLGHSSADRAGDLSSLTLARRVRSSGCSFNQNRTSEMNPHPCLLFLLSFWQEY